MDLTPYVDQLRRELAVAAEAGGADARALAERLTAPLDSATRLVLLDVLSAAADEITRDLAPGSVEVRLRGRDPEFVVTPTPTDADDVEPTLPASPAERTTTPDTEEGGTSRITLRIPEHLKPRIEEAAGREGFSVNTWLVRAVTVALDSGGRRRTRSQTNQSITGWVR